MVHSPRTPPGPPPTEEARRERAGGRGAASWYNDGFLSPGSTAEQRRRPQQRPPATTVGSPPAAAAAPQPRATPKSESAATTLTLSSDYRSGRLGAAAGSNESLTPASRQSGYLPGSRSTGVATAVDSDFGITCGMCCEVLRAPLQLECGHDFCALCLASAGDTLPQPEAGLTGLKCAVCGLFGANPRAAGKLTTKLLGSLPVAIGDDHTRHADEHSFVEDPAAGGTSSQSKCDWCESSAPAAYCEDCKTSLCTPCVRAVHSRRNMNSHSIVPLAAKAKPACRKCPLPGHDRAAVRYYCKTCRSPGCATCVAEKHANHLVVQLADVARDLVSALTENATRILEAKNRLKELVACNQSTRHRVESTGRAFEEQLRSHFDAARRALERDEQLLWTQYHTQRKATADTLSESTRTLLRRLDVVNYNALRNRHKMSKIRTGDLAAAADECVGAFQGRPAFTGLQQGRHGESRRIRLEFDDEEPPYPALYNAGEVAGLFEALRVPRGAGFCFNVPRPETTTSASKAFQLKLDLRTEVISPARTSLTFSAPPQDGAITVTPSADGTIIAFGKLMDWASIRANEVFRSGMHTWTLRLFTYNVMIGVTSEDEHRMDLHKGRGFFWYIDIAGPSFGSLGSSTAALEGIPPLPTLPQPVDVLLTYNAEEATLSAKVAGSDKGVIGTGIAPPVQPAFCFVADSQMITVL